MGLPRCFAIGLAAAIALLSGVADAADDAYPKRPIKIVVPWPPGGVTDIAARLFGKVLSDELGQPVVVENRTGATGRIGSEAVARSPADGYTLVWANSTSHGSVVTSKSVTYDPLRDFTPVTPLFWYSAVLVCNPAIPAKTLQELIAYARAAPKQLSIANSGIGAGNHFMAEYLGQIADLKLTHVPYRGSAQTLQDVVAGTVDCTFDGQARQQVETGSVRAFATTGAERDAQYPNLPTLQEAGIKDYQLVVWQALLGPANLPKPIQAKLFEASAKAKQKLVDEKRLGPVGLNRLDGDTQMLAKLMADEIAKYRAIAAKLSIELE